MKKQLLFKIIASMLVLLMIKANAQVTIHNIFSDNMVLQRNVEIPIWGWGSEGIPVVISFNGQSVNTTVKNGKWLAKLSPMKESATPQNLTVTALSKTIIIKNILIGEVWVCSGQSNMEWALSKSNGGEEAVANSTNDLLRIFNVPHNVKDVPDSNINAKWVLSTPKSTKTISAVGYWFLSKLQKELNVPVGFINVSFGGTVIESWMDKATLESMPFKDKYTSPELSRAEYTANLEKLKPIIDAYQKAKDSAKQFKLPEPPRPSAIPSEYKGATTIFNGEIAPLAPFAVKGIVWYQGESNGYPGRANTYYQLLPAMIDLWRKVWDKKDLPFIIIQLSGDAKLQSQPSENSGKAIIREAQLLATKKIPQTVLVTTSDCGELDVHYKTKEPVGERVKNAALYLTYGKRQTTYTGPLYQSFEVKGNKMVISFTNVGSGLVAKTDSLKPANLYGFVIAGSDKKFYWANAVIKDNTVIVSADEVPNPVAVRYAWADFSFKWNLFNSEGYPASSFRTDNWELSSK
jgi:sialate O-acetylesterase